MTGRGFGPFSFIRAGNRSRSIERLPGSTRLHRLFLWVSLPKKPAAKKEARAPELAGTGEYPAGPGSRSSALGKLACGPGRAVCLLTHNTRRR